MTDVVQHKTNLKLTPLTLTPVGTPLRNGNNVSNMIIDLLWARAKNHLISFLGKSCTDRPFRLELSNRFCIWRLIIINRIFAAALRSVSKILLYVANWFNLGFNNYYSVLNYIHRQYLMADFQVSIRICNHLRNIIYYLTLLVTIKQSVVNI
jgi:hypothetical protein